MTTKKTHHSPLIARRLLSLMSIYSEKHSIIEDFEETFAEIQKAEGSLRAKCWYWGNMLKSISEYLKLTVSWRFAMFMNHLKIACRNFIRHKLYSFINVFGLAVGLSICMIISLWVLRELSYDRFHENADRIYRLERELLRDNLYSRWPIVGGSYKQALIDDYPEIVNAARFWKREFAIRDRKNYIHRQELFAVDNSIFEIFDFHLQKGDEHNALTDPRRVVLTRKNAFKYFGSEDAVGKFLTFEWEGEQVDFKVTGILEEVPENSHVHFDMLISIASYPEERFANWRSNYLYTYVLVREGTSKQDLEKKLRTFVTRRLEPHYVDLLMLNKDMGIHDVLKMHLFPITDIHLYPSINWEVEAGGSISSVYIFSSIAVLILIIACLNFVNLSTARANKRAKEVSLRKTVGAAKSQLKVQFIRESMLLAFVALCLASNMSSLFIQAFNGIFTESLSLSKLLQPKNLVILVGATSFVGVLAGLYPAFYLTRFEPVEVLKGGPRSRSGKSVFRRNMVVIQFSISIVLIVGMFTVFKQMRYIQTRSLGYDKENVIILPARSQKIVQNYEPFRNELENNSRIVSVAASSEVPADTNYGNTNYRRLDSDEPILLYQFFSDYDYVETYRMEVIAGRAFSREFSTDTEGILMLNESAALRFGWTPEEAVGKKLHQGDPNNAVHVVGVVRNFNYKSLRREVEPVALILYPEYIRKISVRIMPGDFERILTFIQEKWESTFSGEEFEFSFLNDRINQLYASEKKMQHLFVIFSSLSILVACLGLLGLVSYTAELRTKEIGIRKVLGASACTVILLMSKDFIKWILLANIVAWPLAWFLMNRWLQNFAYRANLGWIIFLLSGLVAILIASFTFIFQTAKAAWANPVDSLRYE